jgi:hypothetical protein
MASPGAICYRTTMFRATFRVNGVELVADPTRDTKPDWVIRPSTAGLPR